MNYLHKLTNGEGAIIEQLKEAKENIRLYLQEKGNIDFGIDSNYTAVYFNNDGYAESSLYQRIELEADETIAVQLTDGFWIIGEELTANHILDIISLLHENYQSQFKIKAGDKFSSNFCLGIITVREVVNEIAVVDFEDKRESYRNGEKWNICEIISQQETRDIIQVHTTSARKLGESRVWLRNEYDNLVDGIWVNHMVLQNVPCRTLDKDGEQFQVMYKGDWYYAQNIDFE